MRSRGTLLAGRAQVGGPRALRRVPWFCLLDRATGSSSVPSTAWGRTSPSEPLRAMSRYYVVHRDEARLSGARALSLPRRQAATSRGRRTWNRTSAWAAPPRTAASRHVGPGGTAGSPVAGSHPKGTGEAKAPDLGSPRASVTASRHRGPAGGLSGPQMPHARPGVDDSKGRLSEWRPGRVSGHARRPHGSRLLHPFQPRLGGRGVRPTAPSF